MLYAGTPASTRAAPSRQFESYVLTRVVDQSAGLTNIPQANFQQLNGGADYTGFNIGQGFCDDGYSNVYPLGFDFSFDGMVYKAFVANANGWMVLVDPTLGSFTASEVLLEPSHPWKNFAINPTFTSNAVLLSPWFDDLRNVCNPATQLESSPFNFSATKVQRILAGLEPAPTQYNQVSYGVSLCYDTRSAKGRRTVIRWNSLSNYLSPSTVLQFEVVIYENGTIEYRYVPRSAISLQASVVEGATIGIFMPRGTNRFRDFSIGLGYRDDARQEHVHGGYTYTSAYLDQEAPNQEDYPASASYTINLKPYQNWPGLDRGGSVFAFSPPQNRRRVLPRAKTARLSSLPTYPTVARTGDSRLGTSPSAFDDRRSSVFGNRSIVNYPTTLPRFFGGTAPGTLERQDLFAGDFLVTGSISKNAADPYTEEQPQASIPAFAEANQPDQGSAALSSPFFASGSNPALLGLGLMQPLRAKTQIRFQLPINYSTALPSSLSSIFYYNQRTKSWEVPANTTYVMATGGTTPPGGTPGGDWVSPAGDALNNRMIEDARGFDAMGNPVGSGSHVPAGSGDQTDASIGALYTTQNFAQAISHVYPKSIRNNDEYRPTQDETFTLPITQPFLIERAVIEVPLQAGPGWFKDMTQVFQPLTGSAFDFAGPAMTVALMRQIRLSEQNNTTTSRRDIIMTGTITHSFDNTKSIVFASFPNDSSGFQIFPVGFRAFNGVPGAVVQGGATASSAYFTGSAAVQCEAQSTAGAVINYRGNWFTPNDWTITSASLAGFFSSPTIKLGNSQTNVGGGVINKITKVASVAPLGRGGTGFEPAGRAVFGNDIYTLQTLADPSGLTISNPCYFSGALPDQFIATLNNSALANGVNFNLAVPMLSHAPSPYLVMPGDQLVLSISKKRPFVYKTDGSFSGSLSGGHDVTLSLGSVNITLYGSLLQEGTEYHETLNQPLNTNSVHEIVGAEPVLDQFEVAYKSEYTGSFSDNVMLGSLLTSTTVNGKLTFIQGVRDRKLSKLNAANAPSLTTSSADVAINPYKGYRAQPWSERAGGVRPVGLFDSAERYYDSMMPSISDAFAKDGTGIFITTYNGFGRGDQVDVNATGSFADATTHRLGRILLDYPNTTLLGQGYGPIINLNWNKSFPFEPRYSGIARQLKVTNGIYAQYFLNTLASPPVSQIAPLAVDSFVPGIPAVGNAEVIISNVPTILSGTLVFDWYADANLTSLNQYGYFTTGSMVVDDLARTMFGFGDKNTTSVQNLGSSVVVGATHFADYRDVEGPHLTVSSSIASDSSNYCYSPLIRGWKYGVYSGLPAFSKCYWRHGRFGQFRDMLEQRRYTKYYQSPEKKPDDPSFAQGVGPAVVNVRYVNASGKLTKVENTWSNNQSFECTSSLPFFDGVLRDRLAINTSTVKLINSSLVTLKADPKGNVKL
jgi:hypothetical protein